MTMCVFVICLVCSVLPQAQDEWTATLPNELLAMEQARNLRKGHIEWSSTRHDKGRTVHYTSRFANDDQIETNRGDDEGVVFRDRSGNPVRGFEGEAHHVLLTGGLRWTSDGESLVAYLAKVSAQFQFSRDIRAVGLAPNHHRWQQDVHSSVWRSGLETYGQVLYKSSVKNGLRVVRARVEGADKKTRECVWWIDPEKNWGPVRTQYLLDGVVFQESRTTMGRFGDQWFPESVALFRSSYQDGKEPYEVVRIHTATFDEALPDRFTPEDIGVEVGTNIMSQLVPPLDDRPVAWDGKKLVRYRDMAARVRAGELHYGPNFLRTARIRAMQNVAKLRAEGTTESGERGAGRFDDLGMAFVDRSPGLWEQYVERFIARYGLGPDQVQKARTILCYCQEQGQGYLDRHVEEFRKLEAEAKRIKRQETELEAGAARLAVVFEKRKRLERPLVRVFEDQLVPRLERLPTRQQRKAVEVAKPPGKGETRP